MPAQGGQGPLVPIVLGPSVRPAGPGRDRALRPQRLGPGAALERFAAHCGSLDVALERTAAALRAPTGSAPFEAPLAALLNELQTLGRTPWARLCAAVESFGARGLSGGGRKAAGLYYTPEEVAAAVVEVTWSILGDPPAQVRLLDPACGAGIFLCTALERLEGCSVAAEGFDLDPQAAKAARFAVGLCSRPPRSLSLRVGDGLSLMPEGPVDLLLANPPYGTFRDPTDAAAVAARFPGLKGGEIDRASAFLLRSLSLLRPGGVASLLVPDTWTWRTRAGRLRQAVLEQAELAAVADLGKPFGAAKDTRVQAVVLVRRDQPRTTHCAPTRSYRWEGGQLSPLCETPRQELESQAASGFLLLRSGEELRFCRAIEADAVPLEQVAEVIYGLRTGDNARHVGRRPPRAGELPLLGGEDLVAFGLRPRPKALIEPTPALLAAAQRQLGEHRLAIQRIRSNSSQPWVRWLEAAPLPDGAICLDSLSLLRCPSGELAWALLGLLSSATLNRAFRLRTTDVNVKPALLRKLPVPRALLAAPQALARLSRARAAELMGEGTLAPAPARTQAPPLERAIDAEVNRLFALPTALIEALERAHWGSRYAVERGALWPVDPPAGCAAEPRVGAPQGSAA